MSFDTDAKSAGLLTLRESRLKTAEAHHPLSPSHNSGKPAYEVGRNLRRGLRKRVASNVPAQATIEEVAIARPIAPAMGLIAGPTSAMRILARPTRAARL